MVGEPLIQYELCSEAQVIGTWLETLIETEHNGRPVSFGHVLLESDYARQMSSLSSTYPAFPNSRRMTGADLAFFLADCLYYFGKLFAMRMSRPQPRVNCDNPECFCAFVPPSAQLAILGGTSESASICLSKYPYPARRLCSFCDSTCIGFTHAQKEHPHCWTCNEHYHLRDKACQMVINRLIKSRLPWVSAYDLRYPDVFSNLAPGSYDSIALLQTLKDSGEIIPIKGVQYYLDYLVGIHKVTQNPADPMLYGHVDHVGM